MGYKYLLIAVLIIGLAGINSVWPLIKNADATLALTGGFVRISQTAAFGNNLYLLIENQTSPNSYGVYGVLFVRSTDGGQTFSNALLLDNEASSQPLSQMVIDNNTIYVLWNSDSDCFEGRSKTLISKSIDYGASFSKPIEVTDCKYSSSARLAASGNSIFIAWNDLTYPSSDRAAIDVFYTSSNNGGGTFSKPLKLSQSTGIGSMPHLVLKDNGTTTIVLWIEHNPVGKMPAYHMYLATISALDIVSVHSIANLTEEPSAWQIASGIMNGQDSLYVAYVGNATREIFDDTRIEATPIYLIKSTNGIGFDNATDVSLSMPSYSNGQLKLITTNGNVDVIWQTNGGTLSQTFIARSSNGHSFSVIRLPIDKGYIGLYDQEIAASPVENASSLTNSHVVLYAAWHYGSSPGTGDYVEGSTNGILFEKSQDGIAFNSPLELASSSDVKSAPLIAAYGNNVHLSWVEYFSDKPTIVTRTSNDYGNTFSNPVYITMASLVAPEFSSSLAIAAVPILAIIAIHRIRKRP